MYTSSVIAIVALFSASLTSTTFCGSRDSDIPSCAKGCFGSAPTQVCGNDYACYCRNSWLNTLECCVQNACNDPDTSTFNQIVTQVCRNYGVQVALTCPATFSTLATSTPKTSSSSLSSVGVSTTPTSSTPASTAAKTTSTTVAGASTTPASSTPASTTAKTTSTTTAAGASTTPASSTSSSTNSPTTSLPASTSTAGPVPAPAITSSSSSANACTCGGGGGGSSGSGAASSITQTTIPPTSSPTSINPTTLSTIVSSATATLPAKPTIVPAVGTYIYQGCYTEATNGNRALNETRYVDPAAMTVEKCVAFCQGTGMAWAGVEWSQECWCGGAMEFVNGATRLGDSLSGACNMPCVGDATELCGGWAVLGVYQTT